MGYPAFIARRYLQSRRNQGFVSFITAIATFGVVLGTATLIIALSVLGGFEKEITEKVIGFTSHVQVVGFQNQALPDPAGTSRRLEEAFPSIQSVAPFVSREALIRSREARCFQASRRQRAATSGGMSLRAMTMSAGRMTRSSSWPKKGMKSGMRSMGLTA